MRAATDRCGSGAAIVVAGTNAPRDARGVPTGGVTGVGKRYAAQGYQVEYVDYPTNLWPLGPISYNDDVALGKAATERAVARYQARCPGKPVVVAGYSQGARVAGDVLSDAANGRPTVSGRTVSTRGLSGELYSDPRRDGRDGRGGVENVLVGLIPGILLSGPRDGGFGKVPVRQVCVQGDGVCDAPDPLQDPIGAGDALAGYFVKHGDYPGRMRQVPAKGSPAWGDIDCRGRGATRDCVVRQKSTAAILLDRERRPEVHAAFVPVVHAIDHRPALGLPDDVRLSAVRPLVGAGPDSSSGNVGVDWRVAVDGLGGVDVHRTWGTVNALRVGFEIGSTQGRGGAPTGVFGVSIPFTRYEASIPVIDERRIGDIVLNPSILMGPGAPPNAVAQVQCPREPATVTVRDTPRTTPSGPVDVRAAVTPAIIPALGPPTLPTVTPPTLPTVTPPTVVPFASPAAESVSTPVSTPTLAPATVPVETAWVTPTPAPATVPFAGEAAAGAVGQLRAAAASVLGLPV